MQSHVGDPSLNTSSILLTGGGGLIGSRVLELLAPVARQVRLLVRSNSAEMLAENVQAVKANILEPGSLAEAVEGIDTIVHLAGTGLPSSPPAFVNEMVQVNVVGTLNLLEAASRAGVKRIVVASSAAVYGDRDSAGISESVDLTPSSPYGLSKVSQELACAMHYRTHGIDAIALRLFNVYGGRERTSQPSPKLIPTLMSKIANHEPISVFGDGKQTRDFVHVDDVAAAFVAFCAAESHGFQAINIGTGVATPIIEVIEMIEHALGEKAIIDWQPPRSGEVRHSVADIAKAQQLGFTPSIEMKDGIARHIALHANEAATSGK